MIKKEVIVLFYLILLLFSVLNVSAYNFEDYKIQTYNNVEIASEKIHYCNWKLNNENDGYKICNPEIIIWKKRDSPITVNLSENNFDFEITKAIKDNKIKLSYSKNYNLYEKDDKTYVNFTNWEQLDNLNYNIPANIIVGIKINFELPQYKTAFYNFTYKPLNILLDPDISACGNLLQSGTYNLTQNLTTTADCLQIKKDDIIINMNGYTISGDGGDGDYGIDNSLDKNNLIVNGEGIISNFDSAIYSCGDNGNFNGLTISSNDFGIHLTYRSDNNIIENNNINLNDKGIYLAENSGNIIQNNLLTSNNNSIFFFGSLTTVDVIDSSIINNTILSSGKYGIYLFRSSNITIENNNIYSTDRDAIFSSFSSNNTIINNDLWNCCSSGEYSFIYLHESSYNTFEGNRLNYSLNYGIWLKSTQTAKTSSHNFFKDMSITNIVSTSILSTSTGSPATFNLNNTFLNVSFDNESIDANSQLIRQWYYRANVTYSNGTAVDNVILNYYNVSNHFQFSLITDINGLTNITGITEYVNTNQIKGYYSNYTIQANKSGCGIITFSYNVSENKNNLNHIMQFYCECIPNWSPVYEDCLINDTQFKYYNDINECGTNESLPGDNGTYVYCNYCSANITGPFYDPEECPYTGLWVEYYIDENYDACCVVTNISSDCSILTIYTNETVNCTHLEGNIIIFADERPYLKDKIHFYATINISNATKCWSYVTSEDGKLLQTNPQRTEYSESLLFRKEEESRDYFEPVNGIVNAYYRKENLMSYQRFKLGIKCALDNGTIVNGEKWVTPEYDDLRRVTTRSAWGAREMSMLIITFVIVVCLIVFVVWAWKK